MTTAEGGAITISLGDKFDAKEEKMWFKLMSLYGQTKDAYSKIKASSWKYDIVLPGLKANMPDVLASIGLVQLRKFSQILNGRKRVFMAYNEFFGAKDWAILPEEPENAQITYHIYPLRINNINEDQRDRIMECVLENGVSINVHFNPLPNLSLFKNLGYNSEDYPISNTLFGSEISLPIYPQLTENQVVTVCKEVAAAVEDIISN